MRQYILPAIIGFILGFLLVALLGCAASAGKPPAVTAPTGTAIDKADSFVTSAESAVQATKPHADPVGVGLLGLASTAHKSAQDSLSQAKTALATVQDKVNSQAKIIASYGAEVYTLLHSWGHMLQVFVERAFWVIVALVAVHLLAIAATYFLPPPYSAIASIVGKIVNPFGWTTWLLTKLEADAAANTANAALAASTPATSGLAQTAAKVIG